MRQRYVPRVLHDLDLDLLDLGQPLPLPVDQVIKLPMQVSDFWTRHPLLSNAPGRWLDREAIGDKRAAVELLQDSPHTGQRYSPLARFGRELNSPEAYLTGGTRHVVHFHAPPSKKM